MLKQDHICGWCNKTDELAIMQQGGIVHTICIECGSLGPCVSLSDVWSAYRALRARLAESEAQRDKAIKERDGLKQWIERKVVVDSDGDPI